MRWSASSRAVASASSRWTSMPGRTAARCPSRRVAASIGRPAAIHTPFPTRVSLLVVGRASTSQSESVNDQGSCTSHGARLIVVANVGAHEFRMGRRGVAGPPNRAGDEPVRISAPTTAGHARSNARADTTNWIAGLILARAYSRRTVLPTPQLGADRWRAPPLTPAADHQAARTGRRYRSLDDRRTESPARRAKQH